MFGLPSFLSLKIAAIGLVIASASSLALGIYLGKEWEQGQRAQKDVAEMVHAKIRAVARNNAAAKVIVQYRNVASPIVTEIIHEVVEKPVYRDCRISDDAFERLRDLTEKSNAAIRGTVR